MIQSGDPIWTEKVEESDIAQDPLGMDRVTNRLLRELLPGITTISPRARYIAHHLWAAWDTDQRENPGTRAKFLSEMYRRERLLMLSSVRHRLMEEANGKDHRNIVGVSTGENILEQAENSITLDFRFVNARSGSYGQAYVGPLQNMGLIDTPEDADYEVPTERGEEIAKAYNSITTESNFDDFVQQDEISVEDLSGLAKEVCLCQVCETNAPDRETLRELYLGENPAVGMRTQSRYRANSLKLLLHLARLAENGVPFTPNALLDACYFQSIKTEEGYFPADIPEYLEQHASRWKALQAHDYFAYATEAILENWLSYLDENQSTGATIPGFQEEATKPEVLQGIGEIIGFEEIEASTSLSKFLSILWPEKADSSSLEGRGSEPIPIEHSLSERNLADKLSNALDANDWQSVHVYWPPLVLGVILRFSNIQNPDLNSWNWMTAHTEDDVSPGRLKNDIEAIREEDYSIGEFIQWFIEDYVILRAEEVRIDKEASDTRSRGWFDRRGDGWVKLRDHSASHWSARFDSAESILRDLGLLTPNPDNISLTQDGIDFLETGGD